MHAFTPNIVSALVRSTQLQQSCITRVSMRANVSGFIKMTRKTTCKTTYGATT